MNNNILKPIKETDKSSFVGLKIKNNTLEFHYPRTYRISDDIETKYGQMKKILETIFLATRTTEYNMTYSQYSDDVDMKSDVPFLSYLYIIVDYITIGKYKNVEKIIKKENKGKINWKKTIKQIPYIFNGFPIYPSFYTEHDSEYDNVIVDIYKNCLTEAINAFGWLFDIEIDDYIRNTKYKNDEENKDFFIQIINKELSRTFNDKKRYRLKAMEEIIKGLNTQEKSDVVIWGVKNYWFVFEEMLRNMFSNIENKEVKKMYPETSWHIESWNKNIKKEIKKNSPIRPDIIYKKNDKEYLVIDAKYYRYGDTLVTNNLPSSVDIFKQFIYSENIAKIKKRKVYNCFIMPFNKGIREYENNSNYEYIGYATSFFKEDESDSKEKIIGILIDLNYLIDNYSKKFSEKDADELYKLVKKYNEI